MAGQEQEPNQLLPGIVDATDAGPEGAELVVIQLAAGLALIFAGPGGPALGQLAGRVGLGVLLVVERPLEQGRGGAS